MPPLPTDLRNMLSRAIVRAREIAEKGALESLQALAVGDREPHASMTREQKALRNRLRAHGRQLGDVRDESRKTQSINRLVREVAYEHWHRMLFARFLAENNLLIEPQSNVALSMADCEELAREAGEDPWAMAGRFAQRMLPQIFRVDDPALAVELAPETRKALEKVLADLPAAIFTADDSLGWTYQFWQAAEKDAVNARVKSGEKITGETLPAVTQLFTEHYMVLFLLHNTIGAWHAGKILAARSELATSASSEQELRDAVALSAAGGYPFEYLRFVKDDKSGKWRPAAGTFDGWPRRAAELKVLDPCCGSGHFLVAAFDLLVRLRMEEDGFSVETAVQAVIADNLFGLELDTRCTQIAAFNFALAAWRLVGKPIVLPEMQIACSGIATESSKDDWLRLADGAPLRSQGPIRVGLHALHTLFEDAPTLGSLINVSGISAVGAADYETLQPFLAAALAADTQDVEEHERAAAAHGIARAAEILAGPPDGYTLIITNVPYLGRGSQDHILKSFADNNYKEAKADLATMFVSRMLDWIGKDGTVAAVTPQNWLFLTSYRKLRERLLNGRTWNMVIRMGEHAFESSAAAGAFAAMLTICGAKPNEDAVMAGIDVSAPRGQRPIYADEKAILLRGERAGALVDSEPNLGDATSTMEDGTSASAEGLTNGQVDTGDISPGIIHLVPQADQLKNPDATIALRRAPLASLFSTIALAYQGISTGDNESAVRLFWESDVSSEIWCLLQSSAEAAAAFAGREHVLRLAVFDDNHPATIRGREAWSRDGVAVSQTGRLISTRYTGQYFPNIIPVVVPHRSEDIGPVWCFCESGDLERALRATNPKLSVDNGYFGKIPFDLAHWRKVAAERYPNGLPEPQSNDPTQWLFHGHPAGMLEKSDAREPNPRDVLQVAIARLLGYRWPAELDDRMRLDKRAREWVERCRELDSYADQDGIVCLTPLRGEPSAADRLRKLLAGAFGKDWSSAREREFLAAAAEANGGKPAANLEEWLRERFFEEHCKLFHHRPVLWHIWDGLPNGFNALVNYHNLAAPDGEGRKTLESLTYTYLGDWIERQKAGQREGETGADARLAAVLDLRDQLEKILRGEPPHDIFVRWKPLHEQPIGWEPDINDGVRLNIRPFMSAALRKGGRAGAGVLRWKPNIKWTKDRGQEPQLLRPRDEYPWFWGYDEDNLAHQIDFGAPIKDAPLAGREFDGNRWNDLHYTVKAKEAARERAAETVESE